MPGEVSRSYDPCPEPEQQEPRDAIVYDIAAQGEYTPGVLKGEIRRLRNILNECWAAARLLGPDMTGQPYQAWEEPTDLIPQIEELAMDAACYSESTPTEEQEKAAERLNRVFYEGENCPLDPTLSENDRIVIRDDVMTVVGYVTGQGYEES